MVQSVKRMTAKDFCLKYGLVYDTTEYYVKKVFHAGIARLIDQYGDKARKVIQNNEQFKAEAYNVLHSEGSLDQQVSNLEDIIFTYWLRAIQHKNFNSEITFEKYAAMYLNANMENKLASRPDLKDAIDVLVSKYGKAEGLKTGTTYIN